MRCSSRRFAITRVSIGQQPQTTTPVRDLFAPADYFDLTDDEKLAAPSFEEMEAGVQVSGAAYRIDHGWPRDAFFAKGTIGQYVIVIPSKHLVIARFGKTPNWPLDADGVSQLVSDVVAAIGDKAKLAGAQ